MKQNHKSIQTILTISLCLLAILGLALPALGADLPGDMTTKPIIQVTASGSTTVAPDQARISLGVVTHEKELATAQEQNSSLTQKVIQTVKDYGINSQDIQTSGYNIYPQYDYADKEAGVLTGYQVRNEITVVVKDISRVGGLLDVAVKAGANNVNNISFEKSDLSASENDALVKALARGQEKARVLAAAAQMNLGRLININEGYNASIYQNSPNIYMDTAKSLGGGSVPINPGELRVSATVTLIYELN